MTMEMLLKYWFARTLGVATGVNSVDKARDSIIADLHRARTDVKVVSCTADTSYWNDDVLRLLKAQISKYPQMHVEFMIGPDFSNRELEQLVQEGRIHLIRLKRRPPCDCRIINDCDTYVSNHGDSGPRRYCWTFGNVKALKDRLEYYSSLKKAA